MNFWPPKDKTKNWPWYSNIRTDHSLRIYLHFILFQTFSAPFGERNHLIKMKTDVVQHVSVGRVSLADKTLLPPCLSHRPTFLNTFCTIILKPIVWFRRNFASRLSIVNTLDTKKVAQKAISSHHKLNHFRRLKNWYLFFLRMSREADRKCRNQRIEVVEVTARGIPLNILFVYGVWKEFGINR